MTRTAYALLVALAAVAGCDRDKGSSPGGPAAGPDPAAQKPTEEQVRHRTWQAFPAKNVTLLSPLLDVPDNYWKRFNKPADPSAVACYVALRGGPPIRPGEPAGKTEVLLVIVGAVDNAAPSPLDKGKHKWYQPADRGGVEYAMGADWVAKHPVPKDPDAKGPAAKGGDSD
jgi:hypothetical protein